MKLCDFANTFYNLDNNKRYQIYVVNGLDIALDEVEEKGSLYNQFDVVLCTINSAYKAEFYLKDNISSAEVEGWFIKDNIIYVGIERG